MSDLFDAAAAKNLASTAPLADRVRPQTLADFVGQQQLLAKGKMLRRVIEQDAISSMIFWGPPGTGKSTLARIIAAMTKSRFVQLLAVASGVKEFREIIEQAQQERKYHQQRTILFIDEIHRWNKAQQDGLLPYVEQGVITLIGATTENPSFEINAALLSRCQVFVLEQLTIDEIRAIIERALQHGFEKGQVRIEPAALDVLAHLANGDARIALNALDFAVQAHGSARPVVLTQLELQEALQKSHYLYDKTGEQHYNIISALHKSIRGGNADA